MNFQFLDRTSRTPHYFYINSIHNLFLYTPKKSVGYQTLAGIGFECLLTRLPDPGGFSHKFETPNSKFCVLCRTFQKLASFASGTLVARNRPRLRWLFLKKFSPIIPRVMFNHWSLKTSLLQLPQVNTMYFCKNLIKQTQQKFFNTNETSEAAPASVHQLVSKPINNSLVKDSRTTSEAHTRFCMQRKR